LRVIKTEFIQGNKLLFQSADKMLLKFRMWSASLAADMQPHGDVYNLWIWSEQQKESYCENSRRYERIFWSGSSGIKV